MFDTLESGIGLDIVIWLQEHGNQLLDLLAKVIHLCGSPVTLLVLVPIIFWKVDRTLSWQFLVALLLSMLSVTIFKEILQVPRPHLAYPNDVQALVTQNGYGFPSGHVITAMMLSALMIRWINHHWIWYVSIIYVMVIGWARMYAGVHYPQDVLGGLLIGITLAAIYHRLLKRLDETQQFQFQHRDAIELDHM
jgi:membrane-associated phospholipid phosphatase